MCLWGKTNEKKQNQAMTQIFSSNSVCVQRHLLTRQFYEQIYVILPPKCNAGICVQVYFSVTKVLSYAMLEIPNWVPHVGVADTSRYATYLLFQPPDQIQNGGKLFNVSKRRLDRICDQTIVKVAPLLTSFKREIHQLVPVFEIELV